MRLGDHTRKVASFSRVVQTVDSSGHVIAIRIALNRRSVYLQLKNLAKQDASLMQLESLLFIEDNDYKTAQSGLNVRWSP